eukprot:366021-Chlamydomonas_euryale.AAC.4
MRGLEECSLNSLDLGMVAGPPNIVRAALALLSVGRRQWTRAVENSRAFLPRRYFLAVAGWLNHRLPASPVTHERHTSSHTGMPRKREVPRRHESTPHTSAKREGNSLTPWERATLERRWQSPVDAHRFAKRRRSAACVPQSLHVPRQLAHPLQKSQVSAHMCDAFVVLPLRAPVT